MAFAACLAASLGAPAAAQTTPAPAHREQAPAPVSVRGFADAGAEIFHALEAFDAVFDRNTAVRLGGGVTVSLPLRLFADVRVSHMRMRGERAFLFEGTRYRLGIANTFTVVPVQVTGGIRFARRGARAIPYLGAGTGWYRATETSAFDGPGDSARKTTLGYHAVGGADVRLWQHAGVGAEIEWSQVSGGLAGRGIAGALSDTSLGGVTIRARVLVGSW